MGHIHVKLQESVGSYEHVKESVSICNTLRESVKACENRIICENLCEAGLDVRRRAREGTSIYIYIYIHIIHTYHLCVYTYIYIYMWKALAVNEGLESLSLRGNHIGREGAAALGAVIGNQ